MKALLRVDEAAAALAVSRWTIYRWVEQGRLEGTKIGHGTLRIFAHSIDRLVEQNRIEDVSVGAFAQSGHIASTSVAVQ